MKTLMTDSLHSNLAYSAADAVVVAGLLVVTVHLAKVCVRQWMRWAADFYCGGV